MSRQVCIWCGRAFMPRRTGGSRKRFCGRACQINMLSACRAYGQQKFEAGEVTVKELAAALEEARRKKEAL